MKLNLDAADIIKSIVASKQLFEYGDSTTFITHLRCFLKLLIVVDGNT